MADTTHAGAPSYTAVILTTIPNVLPPHTPKTDFAIVLFVQTNDKNSSLKEPEATWVIPDMNLTVGSVSDILAERGIA